MSKKILRPILQIASVALMFVPIPGLGVIAALGMKIAISALIGVGLGVASSILLKPKAAKAPANSQSRLQATFDIHAPRKIVFGHTAMGTDVRYQAYTGTDQDHLDQILCVASHECEAIEELWFDSKLAWSAASGVTSDYTGYLTVAVRNPGTASNGIGIDGVWTSACTLTGCAYLHVRYKLTGATSKATSPFSSAIPSRITVRGKGAKVPDLRVPGVDPADQSTWVYSASGSDSGRNPAWARLFYLIGWRIEGKLAVGRGVPPARLDLATYTTAANHSDETVSLTGGGTEPRYRHDMVYSESEDPASVLGNINAAMNAVPTDDGGRIGVLCLHDDLSDPDILDLTEDDLVDPANEKWDPDAQIQDTVNAVRGQHTDPSDASLYQLAPEQEVTLGDASDDYGSLDGIQRIGSLAAPQIQSGTQWQRLANLTLKRTQFPGIYTANFKAKAWRGRMYRPVRLNHAGLGFTNKLFRVWGITLPTGSVVTLILHEESTSIYSDGGEVAMVAPTPPTAWDPANDPFVGGIGDAGGTAVWSGVIDDNGHKPDNDADVTLLNTAAAVTGQGSLATLSGVTLGTNVYRSGGGPALVNADVITNLGTAAAISGQGALATANTVSTAIANSSSLLRYTSGGLFTGELAADITSTHTASAIAGQGSFATISSISSSLANSNNLMRYASGGLFTGELAADLTSTHTASAISGQGSLATLNAAAWGSQVSGRPTELTDGRVATGLTATTGLLQTGIYGGAGSLTIAQMINGAYGSQIGINPEFQGGVSAGWALYNNAGGTKVSQAIVADATAPNASGYILRISYDGTGTEGSNPSPGFGGTDPDLNVSTTGVSYPGFYAKGTQVLQRVWAKIPAGRRLNFTGNSIGTDGSTAELTSMAGTGAYALYVNIFNIGTVGSFGNFGHIYVSGGANTAFTWDVAKYDMLDLTSAPRVFMGRGGLFDENGVPRFRADLLTSDGTAAAIAGQGSLATASAAAWGSQITGRPAELTDGRITAALDSSGDLARNITTTRRNASNLLGYAGGATFSGELTADVTSTHTASAIASQGALATLSQVNLGASGRVYRDDGTTRLTDALAVTALGTAAAISSQSAWATYSTISPTTMADKTQALETGGYLPAAQIYLAGVNFLSNVFPDELHANRTETRTAAAFTGQAAIATDSDAVARILSMRGGNLNRNGSFTEGATGYVFGSSATYAAVASSGPAPYALKFASGGTTGNCYAYGNNAAYVPVASRRLYFSCYVYSTVAATIVFQPSFNDQGGTYVGSPAVVFNAAANGLWNRYFGSVDVPASAATCRWYFQRTAGDTADTYITSIVISESGPGAIAGTDIFRTDGLTALTQAEIRTPEGTAAAIASQGTFATLSAINSTLADTNNLLRRTSGGLFSGELAADVTSTHTASAIAGQGTLATASTIDYTASVLLYKPGAVEIVETIAYDSISSTGNRADVGMGLTNPSVCSLANSSDTNGKMLEIGDNSGDDSCSFFLNQYMAFDGNGTSGSLYELIFDIEHVNVGTGILYLGLKALDRAGNSLGGSYNYVAATGITPTVGRTLYKAYLQGTGPNAAYHANGSTPSSPQLLPDGTGNGFGAGGTVKIAPMGLIHYSGNPGKTRIHGIYLRKISERSRLFATNGVALNSNMLPANVLYGLIPSLKTAPTLSDTDNTGTVTINIGSAVHVPDSGSTVTFPSGTIAGKAYGTLYYIKRVGVDPISAPTGTGWNASTTLTISVGDVYENYYTTRASGGVPSPPPPPPPGGGGQCVAIEMWIELDGEQFRKAGEAAADWPICILDQETLAGSAVGRIAAVEFSFAPCVRIVTESGGAGVFSETTPLTLPDGSSVNILEGIGRPIFVRDRRGGGLVERWDRIASIEPAGTRSVAHIHAGGVTFAAGEDEQFMLMTHNYDKP